MFDIDSSASEYFKQLLVQENDPNLAIFLTVNNLGTPDAVCDLSFCESGQVHKDDIKYEEDGFDIFIDSKIANYLRGAKFSLEGEGLTKQLKIVAPNIFGNQTEVEEGLYEGINRMLNEEINPMLSNHGGFCQLHDITDDNTVVLQFGGGCQGCGMVDMTLKQGIEVKLKEQFPNITKVIDATDHKSGKNPFM